VRAHRWRKLLVPKRSSLAAAVLQNRCCEIEPGACLEALGFASFAAKFPRGPLEERPRRLARPRTPAFHAGNTGSNPVGDAIEASANATDILGQRQNRTRIALYFAPAPGGACPENCGTSTIQRSTLLHPDAFAQADNEAT
jgi:hypothetical protein